MLVRTRFAVEERVFLSPMDANSAFIRRLTLVRQQGEAWSAQFRTAAGDSRSGGWARIRAILFAIPAVLFLGILLVIALAVVLVLGAVAIVFGLAAAAYRAARQVLGLGGDRRAGADTDVRRVNVRVIGRR
jgi:hypothetical protein